MKTQKSRVVIGIVTYNSAHLIRSCLDALLKQTYRPLRIIILDNDSDDAISSVLAPYLDRVTFIAGTHNLGFGAGHNNIIHASQITKGDYYLALNPDARLTPTYIERLTRSLRVHHADWGIGKLVLDKKTHTLYSVGHAMLRDGYAFNVGYGLKDDGRFSTPREVFGAPGAAALYRGSMIRSIAQRGNFFDPSLFMYYEDVDVDWRAQLAGKHCWYEPTAVAIHPGGIAPPSLTVQILNNRFLMVLKNASVTDLFLYNIPHIMLHCAFRTVMTPKSGIRLVMGTLIGMAHALRSRRRKQNTHIMPVWFRWARDQVTTQPTTISARLLDFIGI
jgi:GT2 family glycosyltransferase